MRSKIFSLLLFSVLCMAAGGCARVRNSVHSFIEDAQDIVHIDVMLNADTDLGAHAQVTKFARLAGYSTEDLHGFRVTTRQFGIFKESRNQFAMGPINFANPTSLQYDSRTPYVITAPTSLAYVSPERIVAESWDEVGAGLQLFVVGARVGIRPMEIIDLAGNLLTLDIQRDNPSWSHRQALRAQRRQAREARRQQATE